MSLTAFLLLLSHEILPPPRRTDPVWLNNSAESHRVAIIVAQQPTQALSTPDLIAVAHNARLRCNELIAETLVIPFGALITASATFGHSE
jgi:hypothetical protein